MWEDGMGRGIERLNALDVERRLAKRAGMHSDGRGLYLCVSSPTARSWIFRYTRGGRAREMGLGPYPEVTLAAAREMAIAARRQLYTGLDPIDAKKTAAMTARLERARAITFKEAAERYIEGHKPGWRNAKHAAQWTSTLATYVYPHFGDVSVAAVDVSLVTKALEPIWAKKPETAARVRGRIEVILDWGKSRGYRHGENTFLRNIPWMTKAPGRALE